MDYTEAAAKAMDTAARLSNTVENVKRLSANLLMPFAVAANQTKDRDLMNLVSEGMAEAQDFCQHLRNELLGVMSDVAELSTEIAHREGLTHEQYKDATLNAIKDPAKRERVRAAAEEMMSGKDVKIGVATIDPRTGEIVELGSADDMDGAIKIIRDTLGGDEDKEEEKHDA